MPNAITNPAFYPTFATIMDSVRVYLNDWQRGATGTPGEGRITTNNPVLSPQTLPALNSAIREVYRELRIVDAPTLIRDNVQVTLPPISSEVSPPNAGVQVSLSVDGFYDGFQVQDVVLPPDLIYPLKLWEKYNATTYFVPMYQAQFGLPSRFQGTCLSDWEWREDRLWFVGALQPVTIRMRYQAKFPNFFSPTLDFNTTEVPIHDCEEAVAYKTAAKITAAISGPQAASYLDGKAAEAMLLLKKAYVHQLQTMEFDRQAYGNQSDGECNDAGGGWNNWGNF